MEKRINLENAAAQAFSFQAGERRFSIRLKTDEASLVYMDLAINGEPLFYGLLCKLNVSVIEPFTQVFTKGERLYFSGTGSVDLTWQAFAEGVSLVYVD